MRQLFRTDRTISTSQVKMRFSLPSIDCPDNSSQPAEGDGLSSVELDGFVFHLALAANIVQLLLTTSDDIPSGIYVTKPC